MQSLSSPTFRLQKVRGRSLHSTSLEFGPGLHVVLAKDTVGHDELFAWLSGVSAPKHGSVTLCDRRPSRDPLLRRQIGTLLPDEHLPDADSVHLALVHIGLSQSRIDAITTELDQLGAPNLLEMCPRKLAPRAHRMIALAIALTTEEPLAFALHDPIQFLPPDARSHVLAKLLECATRIPVIVVLSSAELAARLNGPSLVLTCGSFRQQLSGISHIHTIRIIGIGLRTLAMELTKRAIVRSLCINTHASGYEELLLHSPDPTDLSLDVVRTAQENGIRLISLQTTEVPG